jgi:hypothetical protein
MENEIEPLVETGIRFLESGIYGTKLLAAAELENKETLELETPTMLCKTDLLKCIIFYTMCMDCGDFNYAKRFQTANVKDR